ncbi:hypothetical protein LMG27177_03243 [Paraburkholderia fynbosensis]|uniref:Uncharacterized protein n=1 Tax=Paraburkholderia fynbosensis TaxID=1200993 RepID=A0A6J5G5C5_9BURK|nr:hypothetical protein LMG27177_03243 [Paraburkholderia fynbosensis]
MEVVGNRARGEAMELEREIRTLPCAGIIQIRFKGYFSPARHGPPSSMRRRTPALAAHTIHRPPATWQPVRLNRTAHRGAAHRVLC